MKKVYSILLVLSLGSSVATAWACGDSLYRVGKGVSYRVYTAPLPGNVLIYGSSEAHAELAKALSEAGHRVDVVHTEVELSREMGMGRYDVVIGAYSEHDAIESMVSSNVSGATYLPVVDTEVEAKSMERNYSQVMIASRDEIKHYLKAIHKTLKSKA